MIAETLVGNGERAFQYYEQINPASKNDIIDRYECEPYCYPQNILGDEHPQFGLARNSWLSGTSSWCYQASTQFILGVRPEHAGLAVDPCIPSSWDGYKAVRKCRNAIYNIDIKNPEKVSKGVKNVTVDGKQLDSNIIPYFSDGKEHNVEVIMG
jgi:cellobiose phosphorylase